MNCVLMGRPGKTQKGEVSIIGTYLDNVATKYIPEHIMLAVNIRSVGGPT